MSKQHVEQLKQGVLVAAQNVRRHEARLYLAMAKLYDLVDIAMSRTEAVDFMMHATGKSRRTVYNYLAVGYGLLQGQLTEKQVEVHGYTKIIAAKDSWLKGDSSWAKKSKQLNVISTIAGVRVRSRHFILTDQCAERLDECLLMTRKASRVGRSGLRGKEQALMDVIEFYIAHVEEEAGLPPEKAVA